MACRFQTLAGQPLGEDAQNQDQQAASHSHHSQRGMQDENQSEIDGHPGHVEKREYRVAAQKIAQALHVAQIAVLLGRFAGRRSRVLQIQLQHVAAEHVVELNAGPYQQARTDPLQQSHDHQRDDGGDGDDRQCRKIVAGQHFVINLQHVDGKCQLQNIDEHAEEEGISEEIPARAQKILHEEALSLAAGHRKRKHGRRECLSMADGRGETSGDAVGGSIRRRL